MKKFSLGLVAALFCISSFGQNGRNQKNVRASVGVELASPVGDFSDRNNFGYGGSAQVEYLASPNVGLTLGAGYIGYPGKEIGNSGVKYSSVSQIPVLAGVRYYFIPDIYVSGQAGFSSFNRNIGTAFTLAPAIGIKVSLIDLTLKYMASFKDNYSPDNVSLRVAVTF